MQHLRALLDAPLPEDALGDVRDAHLAAVVAAATALPPEELVAAGLLGRSDERCTWAAVPWPRTWTRSVLTTAPGAGGRHRAMWWRGRTGGVVRLWVDGRSVALPPSDGTSPVQDSGAWVADRLFATEVAVVGRRPGAAPSFGLLVCDPVTGRDRLELPGDDEAWPVPLLRVDGDRVQLLPRPGVAPARTWDLDGPPADGGAPDGGAPDGGAPDGGAPDGGALNGTAPDGAAPDAADPGRADADSDRAAPDRPVPTAPLSGPVPTPRAGSARAAAPARAAPRRR